jgi:hypothetical protein
MVRISNTLLPVSSSGVPQTEITNTSIAITSSGTLNVSDSTAQSSLSSINTAVSGTLNVSDSTAQGSLATIATNTGALSSTLTVSDSTAQTSLATIVTNTNALSSTLNVSDSTAQSSLSSINTALSGTLSVSASSTINGSTGNLFNASSVSNGTQSSNVDLSSYTKHTIYVENTTGNEVRIEARGASGSGFYYHSSIYPYDPSGGSAYEGVLSIKDEVIDAIRLVATGTDTITASVFSRA